MKMTCELRKLLLLAVIGAVVAACQGGEARADVITGVIDIPAAGLGTAAAYFDSATGDIHVAIGSGLIVVGLEGAPFILANRNESTALGIFEQADFGGLVQLSFAGLPAGIYNFGQLLPANPSITTAAEFSAAYPLARLRRGAAGMPDVRTTFSVVSAVPEPSALFLISALGVGVAFSRRRELSSR